jgi:hypothetical protein
MYIHRPCKKWYNHRNWVFSKTLLWNIWQNYNKNAKGTQQLKKVV